MVKIICNSITLATGLTATVLATASCSTPFDSGRYGDWRDQNPDSWQLTSSGSEHQIDSLRSQSLISLADGEIQFTIDSASAADEYVKAALERNPSIRAAERQIERLGARIPQVTSLDDPMFQITPFGEMAQTAAGEVSVMTGVSQRFPSPGTLDARGRVAQQDVAMALADLQQIRLQVIAETRWAFWSFYFTTRAIATTRESRALLSQFKQVAEAEYRAGTRNQADVLRASVELSNLDNELIVLAQRQASAKSMLNQLLDRPADASLPAPIVTDPREISASLDELLQSAAIESPAIQKIHERIQQYRERYSLAKLNRWPDVTVSASYNIVDSDGLSMAANGDDQWWFGLGINVPIWSAKYDATEREALEGMMEGVANLTATQNRVAFQVTDAFLKVSAQQDLVKLFRDVTIPQARQTVDASSSGYRAGSVDFLTLIDNWRKLLNFELMYHRSVTDAEQAIADLERAVGNSVARERQEQSP